MAKKLESTDSGGDILMGIGVIASLIGNLAQAAKTRDLEQQRAGLIQQINGLAQRNRDLERQVRIRIEHYRALRRAYDRLKQETDELNRVVEKSAAEIARLQAEAARFQRELVAATDRVRVLEAAKAPAKPRRRGRAEASS